MGDERPMSASTGAIKKKKDDKSRRRDQRSWENVVKNLTHMPDSDKLVVIQEKYTELHNELRRITSSHQVMERQCLVLQKERDHTHTELTKNILGKAKMESLCRELQKQNRVIKEENITRVKEEEERRREVATSFTEKLNLLTTLMDENKDKSVRLREENMSMTNKLTELYNQFQEREGHLSNMNRQLELQKKLSETQIKKLEVEYEGERQSWEQERQILLENLAKSDEANAALQTNVQSLQEHLGIYKSQYSDFETTMQKSNKVFDAFKEEMAKMQKANAQLEKERNEYRTRWQTCTSSVVQMSEMHQQSVVELRTADRKIQMLEKLCRQLQAERTAYLQQLEENHITPAVLPPPPQEERPAERPPVAGPSGVSSSSSVSSASQRRLSKKEKLLVALKSELKVMEEELKSAGKKTQLEPQPSTSREIVDAFEMDDPSGNEGEYAMVECPSILSMGEQSTDLESFISDLPSSFNSKPSTSQLAIKKAQSCPTIKPKEPKAPSVEESSSSSSLDDLVADLSLDAIPLYKPDGVTNLTNKEEGEPLVAETEARTNLREGAPSTVVSTSTTDIPETSATEETEGIVLSETTTDAGTSAETIPLKEADAKTEIKEA